MEQLQAKYADRDVQFLHMYVREPHAGERGFPNYKDHASYEHKKSYAQEVLEVRKVTIPLLVDGMDQKWHGVLGNLPNMAYVVNKEGKVEYNATWLLADDIDAVLAELVTADDPSCPVEKTMDTAKLGVEI